MHTNVKSLSLIVQSCGQGQVVYKNKSEGHKITDLDILLSTKKASSVELYTVLM